MEQRTERLNPSARSMKPDQDLEQTLQKEMNLFNSFINHMNSIKEVITYFKDKNHKPKKRYERFRTLNTI